MYKILFFILILLPVRLYSQSANLTVNRDYYHLIERYEIMSGKFSETFHTHVKPIQRIRLGGFIDSLHHSFYDELNERDKFNLRYLANDNWEWTTTEQNESKKPLLKYIYRKKSDFLHVDKDDFDLHINPVLYLSGGKESDSDVSTYINTRGLDIRGSISERLGFYSFLSTTQAVYPKYVRAWTAQHGVVPNEGYWKKFGDNGVDYFTARGYISFELVKKYINAQFGFDQSFTGSGHRSFILSDFSPGYTYLRFNTKIWRINYSNLFAQTYADQFFSGTGSNDGKYPKKFLASHHLSINITDNFNLGFFESVVIGDSTERFDIAYLNPIIFYRALEHQGGSSENVIVGADAKWNIGRSVSLYGQFVLDEFFLKEIRAGDGWWANKFAGQLGLKYINAMGIDNLDVQLEYNVARPYMHAHQNIYTNYAHYRQPLGHALGGNFREVVGILRYQPLNRLFLTAQLNIASYGDDETPENNWGKEVMKSYETRMQDYGNKIGQGVETNLTYGDMVITYMWKHNLFFDLRGVFRNLDSELEERTNKTSYFSASMRWNISRKIHDF
ncbi:MAG: hypothetical protein MI975_03430 [Cytophagales bacterium]|nr:hypothetical protein [Cytophagales bacterium]